MRARRYLAGAVMGVLAMGTTSCGSDSGDDVDMTAATGPPSCEAITAFAAQITDTGVVYDYQPSDSPSDQAQMVDVVFAGTLTGGFTDGDGNSGEYVAFEVAVTDVGQGEDVLRPGDHVFVSIDYGSGAVSAETFEEAIPVGAPVVVFANVASDDREFVAAVEGLMTACDGAAPIGMVGTEGEWPGIGSLDEVLAAL
jgi:hypothetical protein